MPLDLAEKIRTDPEYGRVFLQEKAKTSLRYFCRHILGFKDLNTEHDALCEFLQHDPAPIKLILMPRYTFKSSVGTIGDTLWRLTVNPNERFLLYSDAAEKAEGFLTGIKNHLLGAVQGSHFRAVFGPWEVDPKRGVWNQSAITIAHRTSASVEPSIDTAGLETSKVGKHYSVLKFDDLVSDKNVTTKDLMDKVQDVYRNARALLQPSGLTHLFGTRWHFGDLYGRLLAELKGDPRFALFLRKGVEGTTYVFANIGTESLTPERIAEKKKEWGTAKFSCLIQNEPVSAEDQTFKAEAFRFYDPARRDDAAWTGSLYITAVLDAIPPPTHDHGDDAAITVVGTDATHQLYLLDAVAGRLTPEQQIDTLLALHARWRFKAVGLETNAFQRMIKTALERRLAEQRTTRTYQPFTLVEFTGVTQGNKEQRIQGLQPWHERGHLHFPGTRLELLTGVWSQLAFQMLQFPHSQKDDLVDSLAYHLQLTQAGTIHTPAQVIPYSSAAWFEREQQKETYTVMARQPRWTRQPVPELSLS